MILTGLAVGGKSQLVGTLKAGASGRSQGRTAAVVLIIGRQILQALVQPDGVVVGPAKDQLGLERAGINDHFQVRELALEVAEERLDPALVVGGAGTPEVLRDPGAGFDDRIHGQKGVAPNGAELHPVTSISGLVCRHDT